MSLGEIVERIKLNKRVRCVSEKELWDRRVPPAKKNVLLCSPPMN